MVELLRGHVGQLQTTFLFMLLRLLTMNSQCGFDLAGWHAGGTACAAALQEGVNSRALMPMASTAPFRFQAICASRSLSLANVYRVGGDPSGNFMTFSYSAAPSCCLVRAGHK